jgi:hypothetical protein
MLREAKETTISARETVGVTREIGQAQVRAYLSIAKVALNVSYVSQDDVRWKFVIFLRNSGQSPAKGVSIEVALAEDLDTVQSSVGIGDVPGGVDTYETVNKGTSEHDLRMVGEQKTHAVIAAVVTVSGTDVFGGKLSESSRFTARIRLERGSTCEMERGKEIKILVGSPVQQNKNG